MAFWLMRSLRFRLLRLERLKYTLRLQDVRNNSFLSFLYFHRALPFRSVSTHHIRLSPRFFLFIHSGFDHFQSLFHAMYLHLEPLNPRLAFGHYLTHQK
ncbi:unnamed protein product [Albugo candida]|uniref:Uncharacterized protein n=1 Tax=Albugo candida TaxID=65357 RepID=A0A024GSN1_9STRA|nr:unnamed protein product [Albugo candida]|eukprot:CCI49740.1 unnamed protein product [Albugo candida]